MYLKDFDNELFNRLVQNKQVLTYFTDLLYLNSSEANTLQRIYDNAKERWNTLTVPLEVIVKEIESTIIGYSDSRVEKDAKDIDVDLYRSVPAAIQAVVLPGIEDTKKRAFVVDLLNGKVVK